MEQQHILVIDDDAGIRKYLEAFFTEEGYAVDVAESGRQAVAAIADGRNGYSVVFLDMLIPGEENAENIASIQRRLPDSEIVVMTAHASVDKAVGCFKQGVFDFLVKPLDETQLKAAVGRAVMEKSLGARHGGGPMANALLHISRAGTVTDLSAYLEMVLRTVLRATGGNRGSIMLYDEKEGAYVVRASVNITSDEVTPRKPGEPIAGWVAKSRQPVLLERDPREHFNGFTPLASGISSAISVPIIRKDNVLGVLNISTNGGGQRYDQNSVDLVMSVVDEIGQGIERILEIQSRAEEMRSKDFNARLMHTERLAALGRMAAGLAHECNNPLGYIISNVRQWDECLPHICAMIGEAEKSGVSSEDYRNARRSLLDVLGHPSVDAALEECRALISQTMQGADRLAQIVKKLMPISWYGSAERDQVDVNTAVEAALAMLRNEFHLRITLVKDMTPLPPVDGVSGQLVQVFFNILHNAAQAIDGKGTIRVATSSDKDHVSVIIKDTGSGIAPGDLPQIFHPFFTTKDPGKGTGLGLFVCYQIVSGHGGTIIVDSQPGQGSTFIVRLPLCRKGETHAAV